MFGNGVFSPILNLLVLDFEYLLFRHTDYQYQFCGTILVLPCFIVSPNLICHGIVLVNLFCRQIYTVLIEYSELFFLPDMKVDLCGQQFLYFCQKTLAFEKVSFAVNMFCS